MIRRATVDDGPTIAALFRRSFGTLSFLRTLHTPGEDRVFFGRTVAEDEVWVWEDDDRRVLGFAAMGPTAGRRPASFNAPPRRSG
jgi:L-amino acid N-acyltransferase YncA